MSFKNVVLFLKIKKTAIFQTYLWIFFSIDQYLGFIVVGTGTFFNIIFHVGTKEPPTEALLKHQEERKLGKLGNRTTDGKGTKIK